MKHSSSTGPANSGAARAGAEDSEKSAMDRLDQQKFEDSSAFYKRRFKHIKKSHKTDWCIAAGLYLLLVGVAFVIF